MPIENNQQYQITKDLVVKFQNCLDTMLQEDSQDNFFFSTEGIRSEIHPLLIKAQLDAIKSQLEELQTQVKEYENKITPAAP